MVNFQPYGVGESSISLSGAHLSVSGGNASATPIVFSVTARTWRAYDKMKQNNSVFFFYHRSKRRTTKCVKTKCFTRV